MNIALFALGGTISVSGRAKGERLTGAEITAAVPGLDGLGAAVDVPYAAPVGPDLHQVDGQVSGSVTTSAHANVSRISRLGPEFQRLPGHTPTT
ncbi:hypothetical protein [Streptomyces rectiverticillatus]|uniref:hypothetical protein n=1 Tax=Streptomyces rectiverticillatus TaxID=173860 RepID=UPI0015C39C05|nr:hypothetical protein [Streptomyces rectiverticillatus]